MLRAFFDDSGGDGDSPVFVMAGLLAQEETWKAFSEEWRLICDDPDPNALKRLKSAEAFGLRGEFGGWSAAKRDERLKRYVIATNRHHIDRFVIVIPRPAYNRAFSGRFEGKHFDRPYFLTLFMMLSRLHKFASVKNRSPRLEFIFDSQEDSHDAVTAQWPIFNSLVPMHLQNVILSCPRFEKDEDFAPLQAADLLAWLVRREYFEKLRGRDASKQHHHQFLANILDLNTDTFDLVSESRLHEMANLVGEDRRKNK